MGLVLSAVTGKISPAEVANGPDMNNWPNYDPLYGFPNGRKERGMFAISTSYNYILLVNELCCH